MDWSITPSEREFQLMVREWLAEHVPKGSLRSMDTPDGFAEHREWEKVLFDGGLAVVNWPQEFGGRDATIVEWLLFEEEYHLAGAPGRVTQNGISLLGPTLLEFGTERQKRELLPRMASGEVVWAQAWSEPNAGSDLAAVLSSGRPVAGGWLLNGQKTWSTRAAFADRAFGLFRTEPTSNRHHGLSYFMFPLDHEGVTVQPVRRLDGAPGFAEIFLDDVFVSSDEVLGQVGDGWKVAMSTTTSERGMTLRSPGRFVQAANELFELWKRSGEPERHQAEVVDSLVDAYAYRARGYAMAGKALARVPAGGGESSIDKLFWSQLDLRMQRAALEILGPAGGVTDGPAADGGKWMDRFLFALAGPIYAGTNEIQRNLVAQRMLGMPRR